MHILAIRVQAVLKEGVREAACMIAYISLYVYGS